MRGPIDYIVVAFDGNKFDGSILEAVSDAIDQGVIRLLSMAIIIKDSNGNVIAVDGEEATDENAINIDVMKFETLEPIDDEDIDEVAELLEDDTAAGMLVIEQLWAVPLKAAIKKADGVLIAEGRIHPEAAKELV